MGQKSSEAHIKEVVHERITSGFHDPSRTYHGGIDFGLAEGTPIRSTWGGTVVYAGWSEAGYGNLVIVQNGDWQMYYGHLSAFSLFSPSNSTTLPVTVKMTRSQMLVTRSAARSRLWAAHSR